MAAVPDCPDMVWYASYGANMAPERLRAYIAGGTPPGGARANPGCRDRTPPREDRAVQLLGGVYFALESPMWGGGLALYDPELDGAAAARAYLVTAAQFSDIAAQEMYRAPGTDLDLDLDLTTVLRDGRERMGPGRYETLMHAGDLDGTPVLTFTAPWRAREVTPTAPSADYLTVIGRGLLDAHPWDAHEVARYLAECPGARGAWEPDAVAALLADASAANPSDLR